MSTHPDVPTRRRFLATGAALVAGSLVLPAVGAGAGAPSVPRTPPVDADLRAHLAAIMDRPHLEWCDPAERHCDCGRCRVIRSSGLSCPLCGFEGEPIVLGCECRAARTTNIAFCQDRLAEIAGGDPVALGDYSAGTLRRMLRDSLARPDRPCLAHYDRATRERLPFNCGHGNASCPTCGNDMDSGEVPIGADLLAKRLREVRAALAAGGRVI